MGIQSVRTVRLSPIAGISLAILILWIFVSIFRLNFENALWVSQKTTIQRPAVISSVEVDLVEFTAEHFIDFPIQEPYRNRFAELGSRLQVLRKWIELAGRASGEEKERIQFAIEESIRSMMPFIAKNQTSQSPFQDLQQNFNESRGIVIPTGSGTFRFACHLVTNLRRNLKTNLPIQIVYAGDEDLPEEKRKAIASLNLPFEDKIEFLDILDVFDDSTLNMTSGGWAIKAFAALGSRFKEVILLDADAVFLQDPEVVFQQQAYIDKGVLLFHDRKLWQYAFPERHQWWHSQIIHPSAEMSKSLAWTQQYGEEQDSGAVVVDKGRLDVLLGLLHVAWQNTYAVREEVTYRLTYGDKESWWLGFELAGSTYAFERHYGGIVGWPPAVHDSGIDKVCSFVIAHVDESDKLLWYNGGLLKNKMTQPKEFEVPTHWMVDGEWQKGAVKQAMSCMVGSTVHSLTLEEKELLQRAINMAQEVDSKLALIE